MPSCQRVSIVGVGTFRVSRDWRNRQMLLPQADGTRVHSHLSQDAARTYGDDDVDKQHCGQIITG